MVVARGSRRMMMRMTRELPHVMGLLLRVMSADIVLLLVIAAGLFECVGMGTIRGMLRDLMVLLELANLMAYLIMGVFQLMRVLWRVVALRDVVGWRLWCCLHGRRGRRRWRRLLMVLTDVAVRQHRRRPVACRLIGGY